MASSVSVEEIKQKWLDIIDAIDVPLMVVDPDNHQVLRLNGYLAREHDSEPKDLVGRKCFELLADRSRPCSGCKLRKVTQESGQKFQITTDTGQIFDVGSHPLPAGEKGVVQMYRNRTNEEILRRQMVQNEKLAALGLLAGGIAHEINNPIGGILLFAQMIIRHSEEGSQTHQDASQIERAAKRCRVIVQKILQFSRAGASSAQKDVIDLTESLDEALALVKMLPEAKTAEIHEAIGEQRIEVQGHATDLTQVFLNIMQNALQAMRGKGQLEVELQVVQDDGKSWAEVSIQDSGPGIPKEIQEKIFDPFFTTKDPGSGTGLGLAIVHSIITEHDGHVSYSTDPEMGTCFRVRLPL